MKLDQNEIDFIDINSVRKKSNLENINFIVSEFLFFCVEIG